jgi:hypothetical protein
MISVACSGGDVAPGQGGSEQPTLTSSGRPAEVAPVPNAWLQTSAGQKRAGAAGSRCWDGACLEYQGPVTNAEPIVIPAGAGFSVSFDAGAPLATSSTWVPVADVPDTTDADGVLWQRLAYRLTKDEPGKPSPEVGPGTYVFIVHGIWQGRGDIVYSFLVERR